MAPAASILAATSAAAAAASSKRRADTDAEQLLADSSSPLPQPQVADNASHSKSQSQSQQQQPLECPRCRSTNTKFCYYNNYSTSQPRHFCRACRRYWTHGGTLRDVPVGGATRRAKRRKVSDEPSSSPPSHTTTTTQQDAPGLSSTACFPFLSDGSYYLPQLDLGFFAPAAAFSSWPSSSAVPDLYDGLEPWNDGTLTGVTGAWPGDIAGLEFSWPPPGN